MNVRDMEISGWLVTITRYQEPGQVINADNGHDYFDLQHTSHL